MNFSVYQREHCLQRPRPCWALKKKICIQYLPTALIIMLLQQWNCQQKKHKIHLLIPHLFCVFSFHAWFSCRVPQWSAACAQADRNASTLLCQQIFILHCVALGGIFRRVSSAFGCTGRSFIAFGTIFQRAAFLCEGRRQQQSAVRLPRSSQQELISPRPSSLCVSVGLCKLTSQVH